MGALLSNMKGGGGSDVFIDFQNAAPAEQDTTWTELSEVLREGPALLEHVQGYTGCAEPIRLSMAQPGDASELAAWNAIVPCVTEMKRYYEFSLMLERHVPVLLQYLANSDTGLQDEQAHAKLLADVFQFVLQFDELKMNCPQIQNDFSYYRRMMQRHPDNQPVPDDLSYKMSMFLAHATPMMNTLTTACKKAGKTADGARIPDVLAGMANVCYSMVDTKKVTDAKLIKYCQGAMVAAITLYDHVHVLGAFTKKGAIPIKKCVQQLKAQQPEPTQLLNILRYSSAHLNDPDTPTMIQQLLA